MEITFGVLIFCIVAFFVAGFIDSIAGGAGFVTAPSLLLIGMPPHMALGTGKLATSIGSVVALWTFWRSNLILKKIVPVGVLSAMAGASFGAFCALQIDGATMGKVIVIMLPLGILFTVLTGGFKLTEGELPKDHFWLRVVLIGVLIGFYEGFFGPGAGTFFLIALHVFLKIGMVQSSGTAKAFNIAANFAAFLTFASGAAVVHNPVSNLKLASGFARVRDMARAGVSVSLGTDGACSNNSLDMFETMKLAAILAKGYSGDATAVPAMQALKMATEEGARMFRTPGLGTLVPGAPADMIALNLDEPNLCPIFNEASHAVYAASGKDCVFTMVEGKILYDHGIYTDGLYADTAAEMRDLVEWVKGGNDS